MKTEIVVFRIGLVILFLILVGIVAQPIYLMYGTDNKTVVTIDEKWTKSQGSDGQKYLFSDTGGNVYSIEDSYWKWTFDASDRYAFIRPGQTYQIETFGRRSYFFSNYPNAIEINKV